MLKEVGVIDDGNDLSGMLDTISGDLDMEGLLDRLDGDLSLLHEIIPVFIEDIEGRIDRIEMAIGAGDFPLISVEAHTIKGSAGTLSADNLRIAAWELESASRHNADVESYFQKLRECYQRLRWRLIRIVDGSPSP